MTYTIEPYDDSPRDVKDRTGPVGYIVIHGTGSGITVKGLDKGRDPNVVAAEYYDTPGAHAPHYLVTWKPTAVVSPGMKTFDDQPDVVQIAMSDDERMAHAGMKRSKTKIYGFADWVHYYKKGSEWLEAEDALNRYDWWFERWPNKSPAALIPGGDNDKSIGIEILVPVKAKNRGGWARVPFTERQHEVTAWLCAWLFHKHDLPISFARRRILGHEDVNPIGRTARSGPYDPGCLKWWNWDLFFEFFWAQHEALANAPYVEPAFGPGRHE